MTQAANPRVAITTPKRALLAEIDQMNREVYKLTNATQLPGYIRSEVELGIQNEIVFKIGSNEQANGQTIKATENRLDINDAFFVTHYGVFFGYVDTTDPANRGAMRLHSFPNAAVFDAANNGALETCYNGKLSLRVDDRVFIDSMDMMRFLNASTAQQGLEVSTGATTPAYLQSAWSQSDAFAHEVDPLVRLNGPGKNIFKVQLPNSWDFTAGHDTIVAVLYLRGWLSQNGGGFRATGQ